MIRHSRCRIQHEGDDAMTAISPEQVADHMRLVVEKAGTPPGHTGRLLAKQIIPKAAKVLGFTESRVKQIWLKRADVKGHELLNAQIKLEAHKAKVAARRAKADVLAEEYRQVRARALALHASVAAVLPPPLDEAGD